MNWENELAQWKVIAGITNNKGEPAFYPAEPENISQLIKDKNIKYGSREYIDNVFARNPRDISMPAGFRGRKKSR
jgi:hypothetical protein